MGADSGQGCLVKLLAPANSPPWLPPILKRISQGMGEVWESPLRLQSFVTADLPNAANYRGGIVYDSTTTTVKFSNGTVWANIKNTGDVVGPGSATDNAVPRFDGTGGKTLQGSNMIVADDGTPAFTCLTGLAGAIGAGIADYFSTTISLDASSTYEIECRAYFLKTTAGTVTFTWAFSSAPTMASSFYDGTPATGFTTTTITGAPVTGEAHVQAQTTMAHAATGSLTTAVYHVYVFTVTVRTNAATTIQLRATESAGTITPQAGSYMRATKII